MSVCSDCGVIVSIKPVKVEIQGSGVAAVADGALPGNKLRKEVRAGTHYDITVRLDNGVETTVSQDQEPELAVGAAVRIVDGAVIGK